MNLSTSECSSGCESGWTMYLDQSSISADDCERAGGGIIYEDCRSKGTNVDDEEGVDKEDDNLSMVSDASSGPPHHFLEDEECFNATAASFHYANSEQTKRSKQKKKIKEYTGNQKQQQNSYLDDTASSHYLCFSQKSIASSNHQAPKEHSFSATHLKGKKHYNIFEHSTEAGNAGSKKSGGLQGRTRQ